MQSASRRRCRWMSGPGEGALEVPGVTWWLLVSRGILAKGAARAARHRPAVTCSTTPTFVSPLHR